MVAVESTSILRLPRPSHRYASSVASSNGLDRPTEPGTTPPVAAAATTADGDATSSRSSGSARTGATNEDGNPSAATTTTAVSRWARVAPSDPSYRRSVVGPGVGRVRLRA